MMHLIRNPLKKQQGFTLLESLISLTVLSIGLLGIAALFFEGLRSGRTAIYRTEAVYLAGDMADRIRANPLGGTAYTEDGSTKGCIGGTKNCSAAELAAEDRLIWETEIQNLMPGGTEYSVTYAEGTPTNTYVISLSWQEPGFVDAEGNPKPLTYALEMEI